MSKKEIKLLPCDNKTIMLNSIHYNYYIHVKSHKIKSITLKLKVNYTSHKLLLQRDSPPSYQNSQIILNSKIYCHTCTSKINQSTFSFSFSFSFSMKSSMLPKTYLVVGSSQFLAFPSFTE